MRILPAIRSISTVMIAPGIASPLRGSNVLTGVESLFNLANVTSNVYQTLLLNKYRIEDIGFVKVFEIGIKFVWDISGTGQWRWQVSGDGGTTWVTIAEVTGGPGILGLAQVEGAGTWIPSIQTGDDKFQVQLQARAISGTVTTKVYDIETLLGAGDSYIRLTYVKKDKEI